MKRLVLKHKDRPTDDPITYTVTQDLGDMLVVTAKYMIPGHSMNLTRREDGTFVNEHRVEYVQVKLDRRPKPFAVRYESGIGEGSSIKKFATLVEVQTYVKDRWLGRDYIDSDGAFHGDYGHFYLKGCVLADLGQYTEPNEDGWCDWTWKTL
jgi:hypothetical protein